MVTIPTLLLATGRLRDFDFGLAVTTIVIALLVAGEVLRAHGGPKATRTALVTTLATIPVLALFALVIIARFSNVLGK